MVMPRHSIKELQKAMEVKERAMSTALITAQSNGKSDLEMFEIQRSFELELVHMQEEIDRLKNTIKDGQALRLRDIFN